MKIIILRTHWGHFKVNFIFFNGMPYILYIQFCKLYRFIELDMHINLYQNVVKY